MPIKINGSTSGSVTLAAPATGSDVTVTLPGATATVATLADPTFTGTVTIPKIAGVLAAATDTIDTSQTTSSTSYTDLATVGPTVTLTTGTRALVIISARPWNSSAKTSAIASFAISGATTVSAADSYSIQSGLAASSYGIVGPFSRAIYLADLTAGSNTFTMKYKTETGSTTANFDYRRIIVINLGS